MIPLQKVKDIIDKHNILEKELSSGKVDPKLFAKKSKEYSNLGRIILVAKKYVNYENEKRDLEQILKDKDNDAEIIEMAEKDLNEMKLNKEKYERQPERIAKIKPSHNAKPVFVWKWYKWNQSVFMVMKEWID